MMVMICKIFEALNSVLQCSHVQYGVVFADSVGGQQYWV